MSSTHFTREEYRIRTIPMSAPPTAFLAPSLYFEGGCLVHVVCMVDIYPIRAPLFGVILGTEPRQPIVYPCDLQTRTKTLLGPTQGSMNSTIDANFIVYTNCRPCVPFEKNTFTQCFPRSTGVEYPFVLRIPSGILIRRRINQSPMGYRSLYVKGPNALLNLNQRRRTQMRTIPCKMKVS